MNEYAKPLRRYTYTGSISSSVSNHRIKPGYVTERSRLLCENIGIDLKIDRVFKVLGLRAYRNRELITKG